MTQPIDPEREMLLTAYALGELDESAAAEVAAAIQGNPAEREFVESVRRQAAHLQEALAAEPSPEVQTILLPTYPASSYRSLALAASLALVVGAAGTYGLMQIFPKTVAIVEPRVAPYSESQVSTPRPPQMLAPFARDRRPRVVQRDSLQSPETVKESIARSQKKIAEGKYREALGDIDQILTIDPNNAYATAAKPLVTDKMVYADHRAIREGFDRQFTQQMNAAEQGQIPHGDILRYPAQWPDISDTRDRSVADAHELGPQANVGVAINEGKRTTDQIVNLQMEVRNRSVEQKRGVDPTDAATQDQLTRRLPEVRFDTVALGDTLDFMRDISGANIVVDWRELEARGIDRTTPVNLRLRDVSLQTALKAIVRDVGGEKIKFNVDNGVIVIPAEVQYELNAPNTEAYNRIVDNPFLGVLQNPLSTFSIDVDTASYSNIRRFLNEGQRPPLDSVRIEEMVNYFPYDYAPPTGDEPFASHIEVAACPWNAANRLVRVGIKGKEIHRNERPASNLVFLLDVSGSMNEPNKLPLVKESMRSLVNELNGNDRVSMVVYAGSSGLVLPPTPCDRKQDILTAIDKLEAGGSTNGAQGIQLAYDTAVSSFIKGGTNRVILATDGDFNVGITDEGSLTRLIEEKAKSGVFLSVLGFGMGNLKDSTMESLADKGNGNYAYIDTAKEAKKVLVEQMSGTLVTIAKDVKIQIEFNPAQVSSYRLIGYENRMLAKEDFNDDTKDAGEIGAGHTVTALYEVVPAGAGATTQPVDPLKYQPQPAISGHASKELLTLKLRYKQPDGDVSKLIETPVTDDGKTYAQASGDFKFASAVAAFGMILRESPYKGSATFDSVLELAAEGKGTDTGKYRAEFLDLVKKAKAIQ